jgi:predicted nucleic acid-binding protein
MIILDTNVLSELMRPAPDGIVLAWLRAQPLAKLCTTAVNVAEIRYGLARLPPGRRRSDLESRFAALIARGLGNRILSLDDPAAGLYGDLMAGREQAGRRLEGFDGLIAAVARSHNAAIATRNTVDFDGCGIQLINPWQHARH